MKKEKKELNYKNPLCLLWAIPLSILLYIGWLLASMGCMFWCTWMCFRMMIVKDDTDLKKKWNKEFDEFKFKIEKVRK